MSEHLLPWAYLSRVVEGPNRNLHELLSRGHTAEEIAEGIRERAPWINGLLADTEARHDWERAEEDLEEVSRLGGRLICPEDPEWPREALSHAFGFAASGLSEHVRTYQSDAVAPHALWVRGAHVATAMSQAVAVVGTRAMSRYGMDVTRMLTDNLVAHQWTVVSGGALGVDSEVHSTALRLGGATVVVAACGLDRNYPARNKEMFNRVVDSGDGVVISEYPPGVVPQRHRFLTRNRLVAALTQGTVVTEAAWRSGALNTLSWAAGLGRVAMAVPGPVTTVGSLGCHERIRNGDAQMVTSGDDVRALLGAVGALDVDQQYEIQFAGTPVQELSRNELRVFDALSADPITATEISQATGLPLPLTVHLLVELGGRGLVQRSGNNWMRG